MKVMKSELSHYIAELVEKKFGKKVNIELTRPEKQFGDYATNAALQLGKQLGESPRDIAEKLAEKMRKELADKVRDVSVAGPGFINITLTDKALMSSIYDGVVGPSKGQHVLLEYSCPNAFKELHTGHLYQTIVGDALGRILEYTGATVFRANFGGDVGLHVAKCLYGIVSNIGNDGYAKLKDIPKAGRPAWVSEAYVLGAKAYEEGDDAKAQIKDINLQIYGFHKSNDKKSGLAKIYWTCREWSYDYFKDFYKKIQAKPFDKYYPESAMIETGLAVVNKHIGTVFEKSDGALVYKGQDAGLHTRVFITSQGLPTYETKDIGVIFNEVDDFTYDKRALITGNDQTDYMKVVFAALNAIDPDLAVKQTHLTNGIVRFGSGQKMSSRLGNVTRAVDVIDAVSEAVAEEHPNTDYYQTALAAIKYAFLKHRLGSDIAFDIGESVSLEGNSGPYLQYAHARACSILNKTSSQPKKEFIKEFDEKERPLVQKFSEYSEVVEKAASELKPHYICTYLYELAQDFNRFYENAKVIGDSREAIRLQLVARYAGILGKGLKILGIAAPKHM